MSKKFQTVRLTVEVYVSLNTTQDPPVLDRAIKLSRELAKAAQEALNDAHVTNCGVSVKAERVEDE
jgi:hypothetical protein